MQGPRICLKVILVTLVFAAVSQAASYSSVSSMIADNSVKIGDEVKTLEHTVGDGYVGGNVYIAVSSTGVVDDGGSFIISTAKPSIAFKGIFPNAVVNVAQFGISPNVSDNYTQVINAIKFSNGRLKWNGSTTSPPQPYVIGTAIDFNALEASGYPIDDINWEGDGPLDTIIKYTGTGGFLTIGRVTPYYAPGVVMRNLSFFGDGAVGHTSRYIGGYLTTTHGQAGATSTQTGFKLSALAIPKTVLENVRLKFWDTAIHTEDLVYGIHLKNSTIQSCNIGWRMGATTTASTLTRTEIAGCAVGVWLEGTGIQNVQIRDGVLEANYAGAAILSNGAEMVSVSGNYITANVHDFIHIGFHPTTNSTGNILNGLFWYENEGGGLVFGDSVRLAEVYNNAADSTGTYTIRNSYSYQPAGTPRKIFARGNWDAFGLVPWDPYTKFDGGNASEIIHGQSGVRIYSIPNISIPTHTPVVLPFDVERWDDENLHTTAAPTKIVINKPGKYIINANVAFSASTTGYRTVDIRLNGIMPIASDTRVPTPVGSTVVNLSTAYKLTDGDYLEVVVYQTEGASINILAQNNNSLEFGVQLID